MTLDLQAIRERALEVCIHPIKRAPYLPAGELVANAARWGLGVDAAAVYLRARPHHREPWLWLVVATERRVLDGPRAWWGVAWLCEAAECAAASLEPAGAVFGLPPDANGGESVSRAPGGSRQPWATALSSGTLGVEVRQDG